MRRVACLGVVLSASLLSASPLFAQCPDGSPPPCAGARAAAAPNSVAVLYFENATRDTADAYLADGLTEEIISRLSGIGRLTVRSRYLVRRYRGSGLDDPAAIGRSLGVTYLVSGSLRRAGGRLRVNAELIRANGGAQVWGRQFEQQGSDVFAIQEAVAGEVASGVIGRLLPAEREAIAARPTHSTAAYDAYLLGRYYWGKRTTADVVRSAGYFAQAISADSNFAQAWSGLADAYVLFLPTEYDVPGTNPDSILNLAEGAARRALALEPALGEAWTSLGEILEYRWKWVEARAAFERGIALNPRYPTAHLWYGYDLMTWYRPAEAVREFERARELDPLSTVTLVTLALAYDGVGRRADGDAVWEQARALDANHPLLFLYGIIRDLARRDFDRLGADMTRLMLVNGADSASAIALGRRLREPTQREAALRESADGSRVVWSAAVYQFLDGDDRVIDFLSGLAGTPRQADVGSVLLCACMSPRLLADPRFQAVMVRLGYPAVSP